MATADDVIFVFRGQDAVSPVTKGIDSNVNQLGNSVNRFSNNSSTAMNTFSSRMSQAKGHASDLINSLSGMEGALFSIMGIIGVSSISEMILGNSSKAEVNKVLLNNMTQTKQGAESLYKTVDEATNKTLVSMQAVIPALNAFKASTGANEQQLNAAAPGLAQFGGYVYALTGSSAKAETAMFDLSKGIKGVYASLDQYGITEDALKRTGLWNGKESDVEGYIKAVNKVTGNTDALMNTFQGLQAQISKLFSASGKKIGEWILPTLKSWLQGFMDLNKSMGGNLAPGLLITVGGFSALVAILGVLGQVIPPIKSGWGMVTSLIGLNSAATNTNTASTMANTGATALNSGAKNTNITSLLGVIALSNVYMASILSNTGAMGANTSATSANVAMKDLSIGSLLAAFGANNMNTTALIGETIATEGATAATWGLNTAMLANPALWIIGGLMALAGVLIYLKTQTNYFATTQEKANAELDKSKKYIDDLNKKQYSSSQRITKLRQELSKLTPGTREYKDTLKQLNDEEAKNSKYGTQIADAKKKEADARDKLEKAKSREAEATKRLAIATIQYKVATGEISSGEGAKQINDQVTFDNLYKQINDSNASAKQKEEASKKIERWFRESKDGKTPSFETSIGAEKGATLGDLTSSNYIDKIRGFYRLISTSQADVIKNNNEIASSLDFTSTQTKDPNALSNFFKSFDLSKSFKQLNSFNPFEKNKTPSLFPSKSISANAGMKVTDQSGTLKKNQTAFNSSEKSIKRYNDQLDDIKSKANQANNSFPLNMSVIGFDFIQRAYDGLRKIYCMINGCSPGLIPALQRLQSEIKTGDYDINSRINVPNISQLNSKLSNMKQAASNYGVSNSDLKLLNSKINNLTAKSVTKQYIIQEGAIPVDARNLTKEEARKILYLGLEGLDPSKNKEVDT